MKEKSLLELLEKEKREVLLFNSIQEKIRIIKQGFSEGEEPESYRELIKNAKEAGERILSIRREMKDYMNIFSAL